ncbi:hypothetical protein ACN20G_29200 (plasmid) [Streptomyces sp. BI20]|uniref:hypothetical protein n=1 Tax=Streptomyces sp. BI20 TaxID=3403460 RepID=UPI003C73EA42
MTSMTEREHETHYSVGVDGERFTCARVTGLGPQGDGGLPGQELTVTLDGCVLTDAPRAEAWLLDRERTGPRDVTVDETEADGRTVRTTWELTEAAPLHLHGHSATASNHETRVTRVTLKATMITPVLNDPGETT